MKKVFSMLGLVVACGAQAETIPCFTPGTYFGLGLGVSSSYNRLSGQNGPNLDGSEDLPNDATKLNTTGKGQYYIYGTNNVAPSGWSGPGLSALPEIGYTYKVPGSCFTTGAYVNGGVALSGQNVEMPLYIDGADEGFAMSKKYFRVSSKGTVGLGATFGFATGANHWYAIIGWNSTRMSVGPRFGQMYANTVPSSDDTETVAVRNRTGNVSGVTFGIGFDRQITKCFSIGGRIQMLNCGGGKTIRLDPNGSYYPNQLDFNTPAIKVRPQITTFLFVMKYTFAPKKR